MALFQIVHITKYKYSLPVKESINEVRLFPHNFDNQDVLQHQLIVTNNPNIQISNDYYGNQVGIFNILEAHQEMSIESRMLVRVNHSLKIPDIDYSIVADLEEYKSKSIALLRLSYPEVIQNQQELKQILVDIGCEHAPIVEIAQKCSDYIFRNFTYTKGITNVETTVDEILSLRSGVCQDFAHILLQLLRSLGIPSRYVSGYICPNKDGLRGEGATHAWVEVYTTQAGWLGIDPTNNIWTMDNHVKLAVGRNFCDCTPVKGTFNGIAKQTLSVCVSIGYEDGRQFEEINDVQLLEMSKEKQEQLNERESLYHQQ